jgi:hypothetical protein
MRHRTVIFAALALVSAFTLCGCGGSATARLDGGRGRIEIHLTDAPIDLSDIASVLVTLTGVIVYPADSDPSGAELDAGPILLSAHPQSFDLLTLTGGATELLAAGEVPAGDYARIRLEVSEASLVWRDGRVEPLRITPGKVDVPIRFHVARGDTTGVTLDFDAAASVQVNEPSSGESILRPVVTPAPAGG